MKITVITVCLNRGNTIENTIKSVIAQSGQNWDLEYIVVDGGSTDETISIIEKYHTYIKRFVSETDNGIFDAMNKGISMASGEVIAFLNSDDWYEENALNSVMKAFEDSDCDCVCCDNYVLGKSGQKEYFDASKYSVDDLHIHMIYYHSSIFCRKEFFKKNGNFNIQYKIAADYDWFLGIVEKGAKLCYIHQPVFTFCYGGISSVNEIECAMEARQIALFHLNEDEGIYRDKIDGRFCRVVLTASDKELFYFKLTELLGKCQANILWGAGTRGIQCAAWFEQSGIKVDAVVDSNSSLWGSFIGKIPVCSPKILDKKKCNLIITPEKCVDEIKNVLTSKKASNVHVFELNMLCKTLAESLL